MPQGSLCLLGKAVTANLFKDLTQEKGVWPRTGSDCEVLVLASSICHTTITDSSYNVNGRVQTLVGEERLRTKLWEHGTQRKHFVKVCISHVAFLQACSIAL